MFRKLAVVLALSLAACGGEPPAAESTEQLGSESTAIVSGAIDAELDGVVGVLALDRGTACSGVVVTPRLVLTARHCIAPMAGPSADTVDCSATKFGPSSEPAKIHVATTSGGAVLVERHAVVKVLVPEGDSFCGEDIAALVLAKPLPASAVHPIAMRLDRTPEVGETFSAVGVGRSGAEPSGTRRRRDGLKVSCVGIGCKSTHLDEREWWGEGAVCEGDSGGPALDAEGRVFGIASRKREGCTATIYAGLASSAPFVATALKEVDATPESDEKASCSHARASSFGPIGLALALLMFRARKRMSDSQA